MGPLFPRLHVSDAGRGGGPRAPPRNKMALYEQFTVPSSRFSSPAPGRGGGGGGSIAPSTSASQVYGYERPMFQPFNGPSNVPARSSNKTNGNSISRQNSSTRNEPGRLSSQTNNNGVYAAASAVECTLQHRGINVTKNASGKKLATEDQFVVPSINPTRYPQHSTEENTRCATSPQRNPPVSTKPSAKYYSAVDKHLERINVSDTRSARSKEAKEKESAQAHKTVEVGKMSSFQVSGSKIAKVSLMRSKVNDVNNSGRPHLGNTEYQAESMNGSSTKTYNPATSKDTVSCKPCTDLHTTNRNSYLTEENSKEGTAKRKRSLGHHDAEQNADLSDSEESIPELSHEQIVGAIGQKYFLKARRAIQNQQRIFAIQVFELHKLIKVQKSIAASPHVLIEGDPCLGNALLGKKLPDGNLNVKTLSVTNKDVIHPSTDQPDLSKENSEGNPPSPSHDDGLDNHDGQVTSNQAFTSNPTATPAASGNKQNNWGVNPQQNQWLVPVMSPSEGLVYKPYAGPCPPAGSLLSPFYANFTPLSLPSTAYGVPMPHQQQYMAPPGAPAMPMNYFPPFTLQPVMNPQAPASAVEQGSHAAASQPNGNVQSRVSCNMSNPSGIWKFYASRDSQPQASSASSPCERLQGDGSGPVSIFPADSAQNAQPKPSPASRDNQSHVIRVVPHNAQTASESAARIFRSIQMERQQSDL